MTLVIALTAASVATIIWYCSAKARTLQIGTLCLVYWGASLMWTVDAVSGYFSLGAAYFSEAVDNILNDGLLGASVVVLGFVLWLLYLLIKDPIGTVHEALSKKH